MSNTIAFGDANSGFQAGIINGPVDYHAPPERPETPPDPTIVILFARDKDFVERGTILDQIDQKLAGEGSWTALVGLGGIGKSQLAIEYAYRTQAASPQTWVFWVHASNAARFKQSFQDIADRVKVFGRRDPKANIFQLVHDRLCDERKGRWLIVLDNVDDAGFLVEARSSTDDDHQRPLMSYLPHCPNGSVLITSRSRAAAKKLVEQHNIIAIDPMSKSDALKLFRKKLGYHDNSNDGHNIELCAALEYMPLAIVQAAAYIFQRGLRYSVKEYLHDFRKSDGKRPSLLDVEGGELRRDSEAKNSIITTWQISFEHIQKIRPSAADLLSLMSFFDRQGIPESLLHVRDKSEMLLQAQDKRGETGDLDQDIYSSDEEGSQLSVDDGFEKDVQVLENYSFIKNESDRSTFEMHRLVQLATRTWLRAYSLQERWKGQFLKSLDTALPKGEYENWATCLMLFPHVQSAMSQKPKEADSLKDWASVLYKAAWYALEMGNGAEAERLSVKAMEVRKRILGAEDYATLNSMAMVGSAYSLTGQWTAAEELRVQVVEISKNKLGADHPHTLTSMSNLASTYSDQGRWDAAEELQVQVMEARKKKLGADHPDTLTSIGNLASTYGRQGRWGAAEGLQVQVMETRKKKLGVGHPDTLSSMGNLALTYNYQGRWDTAEGLQVQVMEICKSTLGADHPSTLTSMNNLALTYYNQGQWDTAEGLQVQVMEICKSKLGADHPHTLTSMGNLASTYRKQGRWNAAEELQVQVMEISKNKLGADHPDTLTSMNNLAFTWYRKGNMAKALELMHECVEARQRVLGYGHPATVSSLDTLASWRVD